AEQPFFQNRVPAVPHRQREANHLMAIADSRDAIFAPTISARASVVVRKKLPGGAARAVVFAHSSPLPLRKIRPPTLPILLARAIVLQAEVFSGLKPWHELSPHEEFDSLNWSKV